jgi:hypothetical protein
VDRKLRLAQFGCGKMSVYTMPYAMEKGAEIVCAFGRSPHNIGKDIGEIAGVGKTARASYKQGLTQCVSLLSFSA